MNKNRHPHATFVVLMDEATSLRLGCAKIHGERIIPGRGVFCDSILAAQQLAGGSPRFGCKGFTGSSLCSSKCVHLVPHVTLLVGEKPSLAHTSAVHAAAFFSGKAFGSPHISILHGMGNLLRRELICGIGWHLCG